MKYSIINLNTRNELNRYNPLFVYTENAALDNCFIIFEGTEYNLGFSYYHLGIPARVSVINDILFMGFGITIYVYDLVKKEELYVRKDELQVIYEINYFEHLDKVVYLCECRLLCFSGKGEILFENTYNSTIVDWEIEENTILIKLEDGRCLNTLL